MRSYMNAKAMAKTIESALASRSIELPHSAALEIVAEQFGCKDWNTLAARIEAEKRTGKGPVVIQPAIPIMRIFDEEKAKEFYCGFLGFDIDWEHRFEPHLPLYCQVFRSGAKLHLSGHHGDATPGSTAFVPMDGIESFQRELRDKRYPNMNPGLEKVDWGLEVTVIDPFGNRLRFCEQRHV